ncbi:MAG: Plug domain-containing protein [Gemmatimonadales bacterium]
MQDTAARDTIAQDSAPAWLPVFAPDVPGGPLPPAARRVFDADSLRFSDIYTLADLLARIPGAYVARGGFYGQAEYALYAGRGAAGLEVFWDGVPYLALGRDSVFLDPARIPLAPLARVEVLPLPGVLRVYLVSRRQASTHATSSVRVVTGSREITRNTGSFARRWRSGAGVALVADWNSLQGALNSSSSAFSGSDIWVGVEYVPNPRFGASYHQLTSRWEREPEMTRVDKWHFKRRDGMLRFFVAPSGERPGPRFQLTLASTTVERDSAVPPLSTGQILLDASRTWARAHAALSTRLGDRRRPLELEARASWMPLRRVIVAGEARRTRYVGDRIGHRLVGSAGLELPLGASLSGQAVWSDDVPAPLLVGEPPQNTLDLSWALRWERPWLWLELGGGRRDAFAPAGGPAGLKPVDSLGLAPATDYVRVAGALRPVPWLSVSGWYADALGGGADFEPPHQGRLSLTFFSRFLRVFRSGIFALRAEVAAESWSRGLGGFDEAVRNELRGATFLDLNLQMQIGDVTALWVMRNAYGMRTGYVPQLDYPLGLQYFGVRWQFRN